MFINFNEHFKVNSPKYIELKTLFVLFPKPLTTPMFFFHYKYMCTCALIALTLYLNYLMEAMSLL